MNPTISFDYNLGDVTFKIIAEIDPGEPANYCGHPEHWTQSWPREVIKVDMCYPHVVKYVADYSTGRELKEYTSDIKMPSELVDDLFKKHDLEAEIWEAWEKESKQRAVTQYANNIRGI